MDDGLRRDDEVRRDDGVIRNSVTQYLILLHKLHFKHRRFYDHVVEGEAVASEDKEAADEEDEADDGAGAFDRTRQKRYEWEDRDQVEYAIGVLDNHTAEKERLRAGCSVGTGNGELEDSLADRCARKTLDQHV